MAVTSRTSKGSPKKGGARPQKKASSKSGKSARKVASPAGAALQRKTAAKKPAREKAAAPRKKPAAKAKNKSGLPVSPLAPARFPDVADVPGLEMATTRAEIKYKAREDLLLAVMAPGTTVAGALTRSRTASAPVDWCRANLESGAGRVLVSTSGNANAFTGKAGMETVKVTAAAAAKLAGVRQKDVFIGSTGVIGETMPNDKITGALPAAFDTLKPGGFEMAARSIMTTDTFPKACSRTVEIDGSPVVISGIAKGSGMIAPDLATMLSYIFTNASISQRTLGALLDINLRDSFNAITVDSDTSTSDTVLLFATGRGPDGEKAPYTQITRPGDPKLRAFRQALADVMSDLAMQVVRDGEGATKFISVTVTGGESHNSARRIAMAVANSPLVKTAIAGEDANWGRVVMAVGKAGEPADRDRLSIGFGGIEVAKAGQAVDGYDERPVAKHLKGQEVSIDIDVGVGRGEATVYTCDLTHGYISINADYRS
ncbi:MAG: bifunctional glutamate N-acetyltransferase/amino-acid acetyltransferase ArgJ [Candidatus Phaeomarinobacter sp.]